MQATNFETGLCGLLCGEGNQAPALRSRRNRSAAKPTDERSPIPLQELSAHSKIARNTDLRQRSRLERETISLRGHQQEQS